MKRSTIAIGVLSVALVISNGTRADVLAAAEAAATHKESFEKDGLVWVGQLGFGCDARGWQPFQ